MSCEYGLPEVKLINQALHKVGVVVDCPDFIRLRRLSEAWHVEIQHTMGARGHFGNRPHGRVVASPSVHQHERAPAAGLLVMEFYAVDFNIFFHLVGYSIFKLQIYSFFAFNPNLFSLIAMHDF